MDINYLTSLFISIWENCPDNFPVFDSAYLPEEKKVREKLFEEFTEKMNRENGKSKPDTASHEPLTPVAKGLFRIVFGFSESQLDIILSEQYKKVTKQFVKTARQFDPEISIGDIFQACRNAWIMNGIQLMMGKPVELTPSIFAYSMLYPYTDNYLDEPNLNRQEKIAFNERFRLKLSGGEVAPENENETAIFKLVEKIESQFSRDKYPHVYESLLAIHSAQEKSLCLLHKGSALSDDEILSVCIEKGGASVLADGYLVAGDLTQEQQNFLFGFGAYLQLADDIQDVGDDSGNGIMTLFSKAAGKDYLDELTSRTFSFGRSVFEMIDCFEGEKSPEMKALILKSVEMMLIETTLLNGQYYRKSYAEETEKFSPLSAAYLKKRRSKLSPHRISYMKKIAEAAISDL